MIVTVYNLDSINKQKSFTIHHSIIKKRKLRKHQSLKIKIKDMTFVAKISIGNMNGSKLKIGRITVPKNIAKYLKLKNKQKIEVEIK